jgi:spore germination protein GerM
MITRFFLSPKVVGNDCSVVESVQVSVPRSGLPVETALRALLKLGPTIDTNFTAIAKDASLVSLKVSGGTAEVVLNRGLLGYDGGSCNVQMIRSQIEQTLKQFSSVHTVILSEEGKTPEESFQP